MAAAGHEPLPGEATTAPALSPLLLLADDGGDVSGADPVEVQMKGRREFTPRRGG